MILTNEDLIYKEKKWIKSQIQICKDSIFSYSCKIMLQQLHQILKITFIQDHQYLT